MLTKNHWKHFATLKLEIEILELADILPNVSFTTSETESDYLI